MNFEWRVVELGSRYETVGVMGGEWQLVSAEHSYELTSPVPLLSRDISATHGLYYALDVATAYITEVTK